MRDPDVWSRVNERPDLSQWLTVPEGVTLSDPAQLPAGREP